MKEESNRKFIGFWDVKGMLAQGMTVDEAAEVICAQMNEAVEKIKEEVVESNK